MDPILIMLVLFVGAMWLMTRRSRKQQRQAADFRANLEIGQEVMTGSGLFGTIVAVDGDTITLESTPGNETRWIRAAIAKLVPPAEEAGDDLVDEDGVVDDTDLDAHDATTPGAATGSTAAGSTAAGSTATGTYGASSLDRIDIPDDLSTIDDHRKDDGPSTR